MKIKKIIILLIVILLILGTVVAILLVSKKNTEYGSINAQVDLSDIINQQITEVTDINNYYIVKNYINRYYLYLTKTSNENIITAEPITAEEQENIDKQAVYSMLDATYINSTNLTVDNIFNNIEQINESTVVIDKMYVAPMTRSMSIYLVSGKITENATSEKQEFKIIVKMDMSNKTLSLILGKMAEEIFNNNNLGDTLNIDTETTIEPNDYNQYDYNNISTEEYITDMFNEYKTYLISYRDEAYARLEQEYSRKKFTNFEEFNEFVAHKIKSIVIANASSVKTTQYGNYTQYIVNDQYGNSYIFRANAVMDYDVILDTYTVEIPELTEQYNNSTEAEKVLMNIQKVFSAINDGDYNFVYNKLDNTFKQNNFPTLESFENYIQSNFYKDNSISYSNYKTSGNLHIYDISIKNADDEGSNTVTKTFIMQLLDGTDFVMSFNV